MHELNFSVSNIMLLPMSDRHNQFAKHDTAFHEWMRQSDKPTFEAISLMRVVGRRHLECVREKAQSVYTTLKCQRMTKSEIFGHNQPVSS